MPVSISLPLGLCTTIDTRRCIDQHDMILLIDRLRVLPEHRYISKTTYDVTTYRSICPLLAALFPVLSGRRGGHVKLMSTWVNFSSTSSGPKLEKRRGLPHATSKITATFVLRIMKLRNCPGLVRYVRKKNTHATACL